MRTITAVAMDITTACNLRCPECCCSVGTRPVVHYPWDYFEAIAPFIYGIDRVDITGGEPTCHPKFEEFVPKFRSLFGCRLLTLETNGFKVREYSKVLKHFDLIRSSRYPENGEEVSWLLTNFPGYCQNGSTCVEIGAEPDERKHVSRLRRGSGEPCLLGKFEFALYTGGVFYSCRLGPAVRGAVPVAPCTGWQEKVLGTTLPCKVCWFSPEDCGGGKLDVQSA